MTFRLHRRGSWLLAASTAGLALAGGRRLRAQEQAPGRMAPLRRGLKTFFEQHLPDRGRRHCAAQTLEFADDTSVSPVRVLVPKAQDQSAQRRFKRRSTGTPVRIRPAASP